MKTKKERQTEEQAIWLYANHNKCTFEEAQKELWNSPELMAEYIKKVGGE